MTPLCLYFARDSKMSRIAKDKTGLGIKSPHYIQNIARPIQNHKHLTQTIGMASECCLVCVVCVVLKDVSVRSGGVNEPWKEG